MVLDPVKARPLPPQTPPGDGTSTPWALFRIWFFLLVPLTGLSGEYRTELIRFAKILRGICGTLHVVRPATRQLRHSSKLRSTQVAATPVPAIWVRRSRAAFGRPMLVRSSVVAGWSAIRKSSWYSRLA